MRWIVGILLGLALFIVNTSLLLFAAFLWKIMSMQLQAAWLFVLIAAIDISIGVTWWKDNK